MPIWSKFAKNNSLCEDFPTFMISRYNWSSKLIQSVSYRLRPKKKLKTGK